MADLSYLWQNRAKFPVTSILFYKAWAKRILTLKSLIKRNLKRRKFVRKGASIAATAEIGEVDFAGKKTMIRIGAYSCLGRVHVALHEQVVIGERVCINDGVKILTASHDVQDPEWKHLKKAIIIDDFAWIATDAIILPGVHIGRGAVVGAGAVVSKDVAPYEIVAGNPAQVVSKKRSEILDYNPCEFFPFISAWLKG